MKYKKLIVFGDSYSYGHGLPDCFESPVGPGNKPSKLTYADQLAEQLNIPEVLNFSVPGASNKLLNYKIISYGNFTEQDLVLVQFSFKERTFYLNKHANAEMVGTWRLDPTESEHLLEEWEYFLRRSKHEILIDSYLSILLALTFLDSKPCDFHCMTCDNIQFTYEHLVNENNMNIAEGLHTANLYQDNFIRNTINYVKSKMTLQEEFFNFWKYSNDFNDIGLDNSHPGLKSHKYLAELISKKINPTNKSTI